MSSATIRSNPFTTLYVGSAVVGLLHAAATIAYSLAMMAFRWHDEVMDPWHTWTWWRFAISTTWIVPMLFAILFWVNYDSTLWPNIQMGVSLAYIVWGIVHVGWMIVEWTNCNDFTGMHPDVPHCINRFYPSETIPDFSFYLAFVSLCVCLGCTVWWLYFGSALRATANTLLYATRASTTFGVGKKIGDSLETGPSLLVREDHKRQIEKVAQYIGAHIYNNPEIYGYRRGDPNHQNLHKKAEAALHEVMQKNQAGGGTGTGISPQMLSHASGHGFGGLLNAHASFVGHALTNNALRRPG